MTLYDEMAEVAADMLEEFGVAITVKYITTSAYDPATGSATADTVTKSAKGYVDDYADRDIDGTKIKVGDRRVYLSVLDAAGLPIAKPGTTDKLTISQLDYSIVNSKAIPGAGTASLYIVQVRR